MIFFLTESLNGVLTVSGAYKKLVLVYQIEGSVAAEININKCKCCKYKWLERAITVTASLMQHSVALQTNTALRAAMIKRETVSSTFRDRIRSRL